MHLISLTPTNEENHMMSIIFETKLVRFVQEKWRTRSRTVTLTGEEWFELRRSVESDNKRELAAIPALDEYPHFLGPGGVKERAMHSATVRASVLKKIP